MHKSSIPELITFLFLRRQNSCSILVPWTSALRSHNMGGIQGVACPAMGKTVQHVPKSLETHSSTISINPTHWTWFYKRQRTYCSLLPDVHAKKNKPHVRSNNDMNQHWLQPKDEIRVQSDSPQIIMASPSDKTWYWRGSSLVGVCSAWRQLKAIWNRLGVNLDPVAIKAHYRKQSGDNFYWTN